MVSLKSINSELPRVSSIRKWYIPSYFTGVIPDGAEMLSYAYADFDGNVCTSITLYSNGEAREARHYYSNERSDVADITGIIYAWAFDLEMTRHQAVQQIQLACERGIDE